ncbi:MAG: deoxyribodipyrimidine photo-lyase [Sphingomicrobium sp.]
MPALLWFRRDLRLADNVALLAALANGPVVPLFVLDDESPQWQGRDYRIGAAQRWWLHRGLAALNRSLGGKLVLRRGRAADVVVAVAGEIGASAIHATRLYEPWEIATEEALGNRLTLHDGDTLVPPSEVRTASGQSYKIYGPFWRRLSTLLPPSPPLPTPGAPTIADGPTSERLDAWGLRPTKPDWASKFGFDWTPGEAGAAAKLEEFAAHAAAYADQRNLPSIEGTSRLSPHLHWGEVSARQVWHRLDRRNGSKFLKELAWRDFSRSAMLAQPDIGWTNGGSRFNRLEWRTGREADADFAAWTRGRTGFPLVDAGMRQLWTSGWMHNRVRMIVASFLTRHLLIDWRRGERWFWDKLVDADYGNNSLNWQWVAGTGTDSQPFNRIMAPIMQSAKFDAAGYIRRWVPELAHLGDADIHAPADDQRGCYPLRIVGHAEGRARALAALAKLRSAGE